MCHVGLYYTFRFAERVHPYLDLPLVIQLLKGELKVDIASIPFLALVAPTDRCPYKHSLFNPFVHVVPYLCMHLLVRYCHVEPCTVIEDM